MTPLTICVPLLLQQSACVVCYSYLFLADNNECSSNATNNCEQTCINNDGSYTCHCRTGYQLNSDGMTCTGKEI